MTTLSLELSKELQSVCKEKHIEMPESYLSYFYQEITESVVRMATHIITLSEYLAPAYTLDELLEWLPKHIEQDGRVYEKTLLFSYIQNQYEASYLHGMHLMVYHYDPNPCDACGKLLIWLIKENLL